MVFGHRVVAFLGEKLTWATCPRIFFNADIATVGALFF